MIFDALPVWVNALIFAAAAAAVYAAGTRLAVYADGIAERTNVSRVVLGIVLLGVATSLPEIATTVTAAVIGNSALVSANLFGGVSLQLAVLAIVDLVAVRGALTYFTPEPVLLFQGVMLILLLGIALAGAAVGEPIAFWGIGFTPVLLAAGYVATVRLSRSGASLPPWRAINAPDDVSPLTTPRRCR